MIGCHAHKNHTTVMLGIRDKHAAKSLLDQTRSNSRVDRAAASQPGALEFFRGKR